MTWKPLQIRGISFTGPNKVPAVLEFQGGLNIICGASDTGKSFIVEAIDFLLASKGPLRDIPERIGYDRARLVLQPTDNEVFTLERSTSGGDFRLFNGTWLTGVPDVEEISLRQTHTPGRDDTLSKHLLSAIGLADQYVQKNQQGETQSLSFRNLIKLVLVQESEITKQSSPILSGQYVTKTSEYAIFKLLLTGVDDRAIVAQTDLQNEIATTRQNNSAKVDFVDELLAELSTQVKELRINRVEAEMHLSNLEASSEEQQAILTRMERDLDDRIIHRRSLVDKLQVLSGRIDEIGGLLARFDLLKSHYEVDLDRLAAIVESGSFFVHFESLPCPLCGTLPNNQHNAEGCDGDVESVVQAASAEILKVKKLSTELDQTTADLKIEKEELNKQREQINTEYRSINQELQEILSPLKNVQNTFSDTIKQAIEMKRVMDIFNQIKQLEEKKSTLLADMEIPTTPVNPKIDLSTTLLDDYAQKVQQLLQTWDFPGAGRVHFDEITKDIVINGQPRTSRGKGLRAITHAAMTIGLMEFCMERNLSHPGFVVLDSPLLAYYKPESLEDSLEGSELKNKFYNYLAGNHNNSQIIIIENEHPPTQLREQISLTDFTKNPIEGRYGFFPLIEQANLSQ